jgi:8-oxo-dGTP pyrophosphatase MutT (NUDIX family)
MGDFKGKPRIFSGGKSSIDSLHSLKVRLKESLPGIKSQLKMVPNPRPGHKIYLEVEDSCLKAGILILFYPWKEQLHIVFTKRTERVEHHQAQVSFPGGRQEKGETLEQAALRETCEELGIQPGSIHIFGCLTPLYIPPSNYCIYPFVAKTDRRPDFHPSELEVAEIIEIPLDHLLSPLNCRKEMWSMDRGSVEVPFYFFEGYKIWGATAMVLAELLDVSEKFL